MTIEVIPTKNFQREAKPLLKKYVSLKNELLDFTEELRNNLYIGTLIKENTYKNRLAVASKGKGKSGGLRIISYYVELMADEFYRVFLLSIYDKSELENLPDHIIESLIDDIQDEMDNEN